MDNSMRRARGDVFPCASLAEALPQLRRPPTAEPVRFKIQTVAGKLAQIAPYLDARLVFDRLDFFCGERWAGEFEPLPHRRALMDSGDVRCWGEGSFLGSGNTTTIGDDETPDTAGPVSLED
jgi:hypothetical protein